MISEAKKEKFIKELKNKLNQKAYGNTTEETVLVKNFKYFVRFHFLPHYHLSFPLHLLPDLALRNFPAKF